MDNNPVRLNDVLGLYTEKRANKMKEKAKDKGLDPSSVYKSGSGKKDYVFNISKEAEDKQGYYGKTMEKGSNFKMGASSYTSYSETGFSANTSLSNPFNDPLGNSSFDPFGRLEREFQDVIKGMSSSAEYVLPDVIGVSAGGEMVGIEGKSGTFSLLYFSSGPDKGFHYTYTEGKKAGLSAGVGVTVFVGSYMGSTSPSIKTFEGTGYEIGGKIALSLSAWFTTEDSGVGWVGVSYGIGPSLGLSGGVTNTKFLNEKP